MVPSTLEFHTTGSCRRVWYTPKRKYKTDCTPTILAIWQWNVCLGSVLWPSSYSIKKPKSQILALWDRYEEFALELLNIGLKDHSHVSHVSFNWIISLLLSSLVNVRSSFLFLYMDSVIFLSLKYFCYLLSGGSNIFSVSMLFT